jgi:hypothetical protein
LNLFKKIKLDIHHINATFLPYAVVELGPALADGGVTGTRRDSVFAHVLVELDYYKNVKAFQSASTKITSKMLDILYFLEKL